MRSPQELWDALYPLLRHWLVDMGRPLCETGTCAKPPGSNTSQMPRITFVHGLPKDQTPSLYTLCPDAMFGNYHWKLSGRRLRELADRARIYVGRGALHGVV